MKVSPEAGRLAKYKKKEIMRRDVTIRRYVLYANTVRAVLVDVDMQSLVSFLLHVHCAINKSSG